MDEMGLMREILDEALAQANQRRAAKIERLCLRIGGEAGVSTASLQTSFDSLARGTLAEGAELRFEIQPVQCLCGACGLLFQTENRYHSCPRCHQPGARVERGQALALAALELFEPEPLAREDG